MRKLQLVCCSAIVLLLFVSACSNEKNSSDAAIEYGKEFIEKLYTIDAPTVDVEEMGINFFLDYQNEFSPYLIKNEFDEMASKRLFILPLEIASNQNSTITVQNIHFEKYERDNAEENSLDFKHSFTLKFTNLDDNSEEEIEMTGQMTIMNEENELKIYRYYDSGIPAEMLNP